MTDLELFKQITSEMNELFEKKNRNYGNSFSNLYQKFGMLSGIVPLHNKLDRIISLAKGAENNFESIEDSLIDLANYSVMLLVEIKKEQNKLKIKSVNNFCDYHSGEEISGELLRKYTEETHAESKDKNISFDSTSD